MGVTECKSDKGLDADYVGCMEDPDLWFSPRSADKRMAARICGLCPVQKECAEIGQTQEWGVWGGIDRNLTQIEAAAEKRLIKAPLRKDRYRSVMDLWNSDEVLSKAEIGRRLGVGVTTVKWIIAKHTQEGVAA